MPQTATRGSVPAVAPDAPQRRPKLVMVHGTGAGSEDHAGERWWQLDSPFQAELSKRLKLEASRVEIIPFHWDLGPNSENGRRAAGKALYELVSRYEQAGEDYYLMGHSHGGSVIHHALLYAVSIRKPLEHLKAWCTVGTPFLEYRANRFLFSRLGNTGLTLYATAVGALLIAAGLALMYLFGATPFWNSVNATLGQDALVGFYVPVIATLVTYGVICLLLLHNIARLRGGTYSQAVKKKVANVFAGRWLGLWHQDDEAISALANVSSVSGPIIPPSFLVPMVAVLPVLLTVFVCVYSGIYFLLDGSEASPSTLAFFQSVRDALETRNANAAAGAGASPLSAVQAIAVPALIGAAIVAIYVALTGAAVGLLKVVARLVGLPLSKMIDNLVWSSVRQQAWGDDRGHEGVHQIGSHPPEFPAKFVPLPKEISDKLSENSEKHAVVALQKLRQVLGMTRAPQASPDMRSELGKQLTWRELIHTTYFDIPEFVDLAAFGLHTAGLAELDDAYWKPDSRERARGWYSAVATPAPEGNLAAPSAQAA